MIDFRNINSVWASILVETLYRLGLKMAILCPGSRSTPLTIAFAQHPNIEAIPILDERSAAFFALGVAKQSGLPTVLVCTSGTAGANFFPAVIEAKESRVPLLILTADRPPELRNCHSGQTIDQIKLFGHYPNWQTELAVPSLELSQLQYLRQTFVYAWEKSLFPSPGVVHLNLPFRDPLAPIPQPESAAFQTTFSPDEFFQNITPLTLPGWESPPMIKTLIHRWQKIPKGIIIVGTIQPQQVEEFVEAIAFLSSKLGYPVLAEGLSPLRNYSHLLRNLISTYDLILRNPQLQHQLRPHLVIQIGELPTSKALRQWLETTPPPRYILEPSDHNFDPLHGPCHHLRTTPQQIISALPDQIPPDSDYLQLWRKKESQARHLLDSRLAPLEELREGKVAWILAQTLPPHTPLFIANSMPVRDVEYFWPPNPHSIRPYFSRGANGIDGTLSTALGIAHRQPSSILLTGDLAILHDSNGFLLRPKFQGHLTILLINNNGGGIFEMLPIAQFNPPFEEFFATPQSVQFPQLCAAYGIEYEQITSWSHLQQRLNPLPTNGIRLLEIPTQRQIDAQWRKTLFSELSQQLSAR